MIRINDLQVRYKDKLALDMAGPLEFKSGERIGIIGSNGAGKSTLVKAILGILDYNGNIDLDLDRKKIAVHMQFNYYSSAINTRDTIQMIAGRKIESDPKLKELVDYFNFTPLLKKTFKELSGGEKQKLTLILVMGQDSPITIFDEVTSGLDFVTREALMDKIKDYYKDKDTTILLVSHYYQELENICDKLLYLKKGKPLFFGDKDQLFKNYCADSVILVDKNKTSEGLIDEKYRLASSQGKIAAGFNDKVQEKALIDALVEENMAFERLNESIELTVLNALARKEKENE